MKKIAVCFALVLLLAPRAWAWGPEGHEIVAHIASANLMPAAQSRIESLLGLPAEAAMVLSANWADEVRDRRPETSAWHFVNIPLRARDYEPARDCPAQDCAIAQIGRELAVLGDRRRPATARAEALRFVIHFVGDIHQPLHAIDNGDRGGNDIQVRLKGGRVSLHHVWDTSIVAAMGYDAAKVAHGIGRAITPAQRQAWEKDDPAAWVMESAALARHDIYGRLRQGRLPPGYLASETAAARLQLAKAGIRLAWLLNTRLK
jgi:hypothetical protein